MFEQHHYEHPSLEPYSRAIWNEVIYSWAIGLIVATSILAVL